MVAIDVDIEELVVGADLLQLRVGVHERLPVPQPNVVDRSGVVLQRLESQPLFRGEWFHRDLDEVVRFPRQGDVPLNVRRLQLQLARLDEEALEQRRDDLGEHERAAEDQRRRCDGKPVGAQPHVGPCDDGSGGGKADEQPENRQLDMDIGVACPDHDAVVVVEQEVAVQRVGPGLHREIEPQQRGAMRDGGGRDAPGPRVRIDFAMHEVHRSGHEAAQEQDQQHPVLERDVDRKREEVEADVLVEQRIVLAVRHLVDEPEDQVPLTGLAHRDQQSDDERDSQDEQTPQQRRSRRSERPHRRRGQCPDGREARIERRKRSRRCDANRNASVPFAQRSKVDTAKTAMKRAAFVAKIVQKTPTYPIVENHAQSTTTPLARASAMRKTMTAISTPMPLQGMLLRRAVRVRD